MAFAQPILPSKAAEVPSSRKPEWIKIRPPSGESYQEIKALLRERKLHTVCEEARCPNLSECWKGGTATFMLGGDTCTRACRFCAIKTARRPPPLDPKEPEHVAKSVADLGLRYVVLTSVDRDDLEDGGANHFAETVRAIKRLNSEIVVEALVSDFRGNRDAIRAVVESGLDVYAHNIETVREYHPRVRDPRAGYFQSLETLREAKRFAKEMGRTLYTKSSIMLGFGESLDQLRESFRDLSDYAVDVLTLGQYLRPTLQHIPVERFLTPREFVELEAIAMRERFLYVASGPLVRSSYKAAEFFIEGVIRNPKERKEPNAI